MAGPPVPLRVGPFAESKIDCQRDLSLDGHAEPTELRHSRLGESGFRPMVPGLLLPNTVTLTA
jgi:hypothetical protein